MRIGLVRRGFSASGGAEAYLRRFAEAAREAGHASVLFTGEEWPAGAWPQARVPVGGKTPREFADALEKVQPRAHCDFLLSLERVWQCDAYRAGDGVHAAWLERRGRFEPSWRKLVRRWQRKHAEILELERRLFTGGARQIITNSRLVKQEIMERFQTPELAIAVVPNGVPPLQIPHPERADIRRELGLAADAYVVLFAGSGWARKGLRVAIRAVDRAHSEATLLVAGRGAPRTMPRSRRTRYLGVRADLPRLLAAADGFILPTIYDPFSNACLEALAAGLPVLTTSANGFSEIIEPSVEGEVIADPGDVAAFTQAIDAWAEPARRQAMRAPLLARSAHFTIAENLSTTLAIIEKAADTARPA